MKNDNIQKLVKLITENPDLPVIPLVDSDVISDDYENGRYVSEIGLSFIDYCGLVGDRFCTGEDDYKVVLYDALEIDFEGLSNEEIEKRLDKAFNENCREYIIVYICPNSSLM